MQQNTSGKFSGQYREQTQEQELAQQYQQAPAETQPQQMPPQNKANAKHSPTMAQDLIFTIITLFISRLLGIGSGIFLILSESAWKKQNYVDYNIYRKLGRIIRIIGYAIIGLGLLAAFVYIGARMFGFTSPTGLGH